MRGVNCKRSSKIYRTSEVIDRLSESKYYHLYALPKGGKAMYNKVMNLYQKKVSEALLEGCVIDVPILGKIGVYEFDRIISTSITRKVKWKNAIRIGYSYRLKCDSKMLKANRMKLEIANSFQRKMLNIINTTNTPFRSYE